MVFVLILSNAAVVHLNGKGLFSKILRILVSWE